MILELGKKLTFFVFIHDFTNNHVYTKTTLSLRQIGFWISTKKYEIEERYNLRGSPYYMIIQAGRVSCISPLFHTP